MRNTTVQTSNGVNLNITIKNPRVVCLSPTADKYEILGEDGSIKSLIYCKDLTFSIGQIIKISKQAFKILAIEKDVSTINSSYLLKTQKKITKTSLFIMPFLGHDRRHFNWDYSFVNSFIGTEKFGDYGSSLYLLFKFNGEVDFEEKLQSHPCYKNTSDPDKYQTMYEFNMPDEFSEDIAKILKGKYSEISVQAKNRILTFHNSNENRPLGQILSKAEERRLKMQIDLRHDIPEGNELTDCFNPEDEIFMNKFIIEDDTKSREYFENSETV